MTLLRPLRRPADLPSSRAAWTNVAGDAFVIIVIAVALFEAFR